MATSPHSSREELVAAMAEIDRRENEDSSIFPPRAKPRLIALYRRHLDLDTRVEAELKRPHPCSLELQRLRRQKLYLKDQIRALVS